MMSELGARPKLQFWAKMSKKRTRKIEIQRIQIPSSRTPYNGKKTIQAFESLNFDVRARSQARDTILGQDEQETDAKNWTSTNLVSQLTNPLEEVKKTFQAFESLNSDVQARSNAQITILVRGEHEVDVKNRTSTNSISEHTNPLQLIKNHVSLWNGSILISELGVRPKLRFQAQMSF